MLAVISQCDDHTDDGNDNNGNDKNEFELQKVNYGGDEYAQLMKVHVI